MMFKSILNHFKAIRKLKKGDGDFVVERYPFTHTFWKNRGYGDSVLAVFYPTDMDGFHFLISPRFKKVKWWTIEEEMYYPLPYFEYVLNKKFDIVSKEQRNKTVSGEDYWIYKVNKKPS